MRELLVIFFAVTLVAALEGSRRLWQWAAERRREELRRRLRTLTTGTGVGGTSLLREGKLAKSAVLEALLARLPLTRRIERVLIQADAGFSVAQFLVWCSLAALAGLCAGLLLRMGPLLSAILAAAGAGVPFAGLAVIRDRRSRALSEQLPEALDMLSRSLRAGHALTSAFEVVATEMPEPVATEFGRAFEAQRLGLPVDQAIVQMTERAAGNRDLRVFAVSVLIQRETGGNLAEILGNIAETIRARYRFYGKLRALTAEGRASGFVLALLPLVMAVVLSVVNPHYLDPLALTPTGRIILLATCTSWCAGVVWLYQLTKVDI